jgi:hypothetical protein
MSPTRLLGLATALVALLAATPVTAGATARPRARPDRGTAAVATTPRTSGATQYIAGFDSDAILGQGAITTGRGSLAGHSLTARFSGTGRLGGGYTFTYHGTYR